MTIVGYVREPTADDLRRHPHCAMGPDSGFRPVVVDEFQLPHTRWAPVEHPTGMRCRYTVGPRHTTCKARPVATLDRARFNAPRRQRWAYCGRHLYGRTLEDGRLLTVILVDRNETP